jgi:glycosyltransferase involved in cell wall biosynthesis
VRRFAIDATSIRSLRSGTGRRLVELYGADPEGFAALGDWLILAAPEREAELRARLPFAEVRPHAAPPSPAARALYGHRRLLRQLRDVDLILQDTRPFADPTRTLPCIHDLRHLSRGAASPLFRAWMRSRFPVALRACPRLTTVSEHVRRQLAKLSGRPLDDIDVVSNGVDAAAFRGASLEPLNALGLEPGDYVLSVGHREPRKNPAFLARLIAADRARGGDLRFIHVGAAASPRDPFAAARREAGLEDLWRLLDALPETTLRALYRGAAVFLMPSLIEGFGIPLLEAMAAGTPVIAADHPPFDEIAAAEDRLALEPRAWLERVDRLREEGGEREAARIRGVDRAALFTWSRAAAAQITALTRALQCS